MLSSLRSLLSGERSRVLEAELAEARLALTRWKALVAETRNAAAAEARRTPTRDVLRALLPARLEAVRTRAGSSVMRQRHAAFLNECGAYREAVAQLDIDDPSLVDVWMGGIHWWVPAGNRPPGRQARQRAQDLPLRDVLQTREVAVGPVMVEVGASIGLTSITRVVLGDVGVSYAAEPDPEKYRCLVRTIVANSLAGLVFPDRCGIGDIDGEMSLPRPLGRTDHAPDGASSEVMRVPCRRLDSWLAARRVDLEAVSFVKVGVRGGEPRVLQGAPAVLAKRHIAWQVGVEPRQLEAAGSSLQELLSILQAHFAHFVDVHPEATGPRLRAISELASSLGYLADGRAQQTDLVLIA